jgi:hypothetical protein
MTLANQVLALAGLTSITIILAVCFGFALGKWAVHTGRA